MEMDIKDTAPVKEKSVKPKGLEYQRAQDREIVRGIFHYYEVPGGCMSFVFHKYKGDPVERYDLLDGHQYSLPLGVAKHLNGNCNYPIHGYMTDEHGKPSMRVNEKVHRTGFQSLEFIDIADLPQPGKSIINVQHL
jgi:hypothetical protein